jgi:hypothetical protein
MPFEDYLDCRGFGYVSSLISSIQYDIIIRHLAEFGIPKHDFLIFVFSKIRGQRGVSDTYLSYIRESKEELWDSREDLREFFTRQENYDRLISGELGDNLMRKYRTIMMAYHGREFIDFLYDCIKKMLKSHDKPVLDSLEAARLWLLSTRDVLKMFQEPEYKHKADSLVLEYDVLSWYRQERQPLQSFRGKTEYKISTDHRRMEGLFDSARKLYHGGDVSYFIGKTMINWSIKNFWRECEHDSHR